MRPTFISAFTPDYAEQMIRLTNSMVKHGLKYHISRINETGSWVKNCAAKPSIIQGAREALKGEIVWVDADAEFVQYPIIFDAGVYDQYDAAVCEYEWHGGKKEMLSGTVWFNDTPGARRLLWLWTSMQAENRAEMDQRVLADAVVQARNEGVLVGNLFVEYCFIFDLHRREHPSADPVIVHYQHSRVRRQEDRRR